MKKPPAAAPVPVVTRLTPLQDKTEGMGLLVKREDLACAEPGPPSGRMRGVYAHAARLVRGGVKALGVLDGGRGSEVWAVAYAARLLQVPCVIYLPAGVTAPSRAALEAAKLGAEPVVLNVDPAYVVAFREFALGDIKARSGALMPPGLKLDETTAEVAAEVIKTFENATRDEFQVLRSEAWLVSMGSAAVARGVITGLVEARGNIPMAPILIHLPQERAFGGSDLAELCRLSPAVRLVDEDYAPGEDARPGPGPEPDWPVDLSDLKALRWWARFGRDHYGQATFWSVG